jgi:hypothetical protein
MIHREFNKRRYEDNYTPEEIYHMKHNNGPLPTHMHFVYNYKIGDIVMYYEYTSSQLGKRIHVGKIIEVCKGGYLLELIRSHNQMEDWYQISGRKYVSNRFEIYLVQII